MGASWTIGLTGDVGSGKSAVRSWLAARGAATLDADEVVHRLLTGDGPVVDAVARRFGLPSRRPAGGLDRAVLAAHVFGDPEALADLERIVHPVVLAETARWLDHSGADVAVVEAVKLVETGMHAAFDRVWLVACDRAVRRARLLDRGWSPDEVDRRIAAGTPLAPRLAVADIVIDNTGAWPATERQLERAWSALGRHTAIRH